jgi:glycosyltransferase involved in cell wall biosynthesis
MNRTGKIIHPSTLYTIIYTTSIISGGHMKIGIDSRASIWYRGTGIGTYAYQMIHNISLIDKINQYLLFFPEDKTFSLNPGENIDIRKISDHTTDNFWSDINIPNILTDKGTDIYFIPQNGIGMPKDKSCSFAITLHDVIPYRMPETVGPQYLEIYNREMPGIIPRCDSIITVSQYSKKDIAQALGFPEDKIHVTHLAAEDIYFPRNRGCCIEYLKSAYGIDGNYILYVGGFSPRKNIKGLIQAFGIIKSKLKCDYKLVILGKKGRSYYDYRDLTYSLGLKEDVIFTGYVPVEELPIFYNGAKIFCYPSFYEGFGLPPLEAMACGTPVIASNVTSMPEILSDACEYVNPSDVEEMASKLELLIEDEKLRTSLTFRGLQKSSEYSWKRTAAETIRILMDTAGGE